MKELAYSQILGPGMDMLSMHAGCCKTSSVGRALETTKDLPVWEDLSRGEDGSSLLASVPLPSIFYKYKPLAEVRIMDAETYCTLEQFLLK